MTNRAWIVFFDESGVSLRPSVGRLLRSLGLSPQRPLHRAYQQDPDAVQHFTTEEYPHIREAAAREGATIYFADETGDPFELPLRHHLGSGR